MSDCSDHMPAITWIVTELSLAGLCGCLFFQVKALKQRLTLNDRIKLALLDSLHEACYILAPDGKILDANHGFLRLLGYNLQQLQGLPIEQWLTGISPAKIQETLSAIRHNALTLQEPAQFKTRRGDTVRASVTASPLRVGQEVLIIACFSPTAATTRYTGEVFDLAFRDPLTGAANRKLLEDRISHAIELAERHASYLAIIFIDLDDFKTVNDDYGHQAGDRVLVSTALRVREILRKSDTLARYGGDEFVAVCEHLGADIETAKQNALEILQKIVATLSQPLEIEGHWIKCTPSIGAILSLHPKMTEQDLVTAADQAMYRVKKNGKAGYCLVNDRLQDIR